MAHYLPVLLSIKFFGQSSKYFQWFFRKIRPWFIKDISNGDWWATLRSFSFHQTRNFHFQLMSYRKWSEHPPILQKFLDLVVNNSHFTSHIELLFLAKLSVCFCFLQVPGHCAVPVGHRLLHLLGHLQRAQELVLIHPLQRLRIPPHVWWEFGKINLLCEEKYRLFYFCWLILTKFLLWLFYSLPEGRPDLQAIAGLSQTWQYLLAVVSWAHFSASARTVVPKRKASQ